MAASDYKVLNGLGIELATGEQVRISTHTATPEGVITAPIGSLCTDNSNGKLYKKTTGVDNTGWMEVAGQEAIDMFDWKGPVVTVATENIDLSTIGVATEINGVTPSAGERVGVVGQTDPIENGIYIAGTSGNWARSSDANADTELNPGTAFAVSGTGALAGAIYVLTVGTTVAGSKIFARINPVYTGTTAGGVTISNSVVSIANHLSVIDTAINPAATAIDVSPYNTACWYVYLKDNAGTSRTGAIVHAISNGTTVDYNVSSILKVGTGLTATYTVTYDSGLKLTVTPSASGYYSLTRDAVLAATV